MKGKEGIKRLAAASLLLMFVAFYVNATMFWHSHIINGVTIVHSHIHGFSHTSSSDGGHSVREITLISMCTSVHIMANDGAGTVACAELPLLAVLIECTGFFLFARIAFPSFLRAPPYMSVAS